jgi:hypothetical protein
MDMIKKNKKAQISIYIITAVITILLGLGIFIIANSDIRKKEALSLSSNFDVLENYIKNCFETTSKQGIIIVGSQGGHIYNSDEVFNSPYGNLSYGFYLGQNKLPSKENISNEISNYIADAIESCLDFSDLPQFQITSADKRISTIIVEQEVIIEMEYPLLADTEESQKRFNMFRYSAPIRLGYIHSVAESLVEKNIQDPFNIDITYIAGIDMNISFFPASEDVIIYTIVDENSILNEKEYLFIFANKFRKIQPPKIEIDDLFIIYQGDVFVHRVNVNASTESILEFSDNTALFDISYDGMIFFPTKIPGDYNVTIRVNDQYGNQDEKEVMFRIIGD